MTIPPFCPTSTCRNHHIPKGPIREHRRWYRKDGTYPSRLHGRVQRFVCTSCGRKFSTQTFSLDYGVKRTVCYQRIFQQITCGSGVRSLARHLGVSDTVILNRISRLARQSIALHAALRPFCLSREAFVTDGFESFTLSQYFPNNIHLIVGKDSQYLYGIDYAHLRRKGRMREDQKQKRAEIERYFSAYTGDIHRSFTRTVRQMIEYRRDNADIPLEVYSDEKTDYRRVLAPLAAKGKVRHLCVPSTAPRSVSSDLFAVNYFDRELRKDSGNHVRETVEFSRDVNNCMDRLWVYAAYHNYVKPYRINSPGGKCGNHAEQTGIPGRKIRAVWKTFFTQRAFISRVSVSESEWYAWYRCYATPMKMRMRDYPRYAAA
jgi:transposase-like protein